MNIHFFSRHRWTSDRWRTHLGQDSIQPLKWSVQMKLYPAWSWCDCLTTIFSTPTLNERHPNCTHSCEPVYGLKPLINRLCKQRSKLLVIEYLQITTRRDFAYLYFFKRKRYISCILKPYFMITKHLHKIGNYLQLLGAIHISDYN